MATKTKAKKKAAAAGKAKAPAPVDAKKLLQAFDGLAGDVLNHIPGLDEFEKQGEVVEELEEQLADARATLEVCARPIRKVWDLIHSEQLKKLAEGRPYDDGLRSAISAVQLKSESWNWGGGKPTGAKPWSELRKHGATDEQILRNLQNLKPRYAMSMAMKYELQATGNSLQLYRYTGPGRRKVILSGKERLIAEVRRVMGIGQPKAARTKASKPTSKTSKSHDNPSAPGKTTGGTRRKHKKARILVSANGATDDGGAGPIGGERTSFATATRPTAGGERPAASLPTKAVGTPRKAK